MAIGQETDFADYHRKLNVYTVLEDPRCVYDFSVHVCHSDVWDRLGTCIRIDNRNVFRLQ